MLKCNPASSELLVNLLQLKINRSTELWHKSSYVLNWVEDSSNNSSLVY